MALVLEWLAGAMLLAGALLVLAGGIGALRFDDFYTRMHAASLTDSLGPILILLGCALHTGWSLPSLKLALVLIFLLITSPTAAYALANAALLSGMKPGGGFKPPEEGE